MTEATPTARTLPTLEQMNAKIMRENVAKITADLRRLADRIDADAEAMLNPEQPTTSYSRFAALTVHQMTWGFANLGLDNLVSTAAGAEVARAKGE